MADSVKVENIKIEHCGYSVKLPVHVLTIKTHDGQRTLNVEWFTIIMLFYVLFLFTYSRSFYLWVSALKPRKNTLYGSS